MPEVIRDKYQYFTQANIEKLKATGYQGPKFSSRASGNRLRAELSRPSSAPGALARQVQTLLASE